MTNAHGFDWNRKKNKKKARASRTPGKTKCLSCQASISDKFFAKRSRSYKRRNYYQWALFMKTGNVKVPI